LTQKGVTVRKRYPVMALAVILRLGWPGEGRAADLDELSKYLAFIEGFQHLFEFCQAEAKLPVTQVKYARDHIGPSGPDLRRIERKRANEDLG